MRDFDAEASHEPGATFRLGGREWQLRSKDAVPFGAVLDFDGAQIGREQVEKFFATVIDPVQADDFAALLHAPDSPITLAMVTSLFEWITEQITGFPTTEPRP